MGREKIYYFDNNATTRIAPEVAEAMQPFFAERWGNPSSLYTFGKEVARDVDLARSRAAALLNADPRDVIFTSGGTESNNTAIHSALLTNPDKRHIVTTAVEHSAILRFGARLETRGYELTRLPVDSDGSIDLHQLESSIRPDTAIVSAMWANNETGVIFPIAEIAAICRGKGVLCHTDAVQAPGKLKIDVAAMGVDFLSLSAHKFYAPKGIGVLYIRGGVPYAPYVVGGHQERDRRGGTENVPYIVALGRAAELANARRTDEIARVRQRRDWLEDGILASIPGACRNGAKEPRLPNTTNLSFDGVESEGILLALDDARICASSGSACTTGLLEPSHVLKAMGFHLARARSSVRFSLGFDTTDDDVDYLLGRLPSIIRKLRDSPAAVER